MSYTSFVNIFHRLRRNGNAVKSALHNKQVQEYNSDIKCFWPLTSLIDRWMNKKKIRGLSARNDHPLMPTTENRKVHLWIEKYSNVYPQRGPTEKYRNIEILKNIDMFTRSADKLTARSIDHCASLCRRETSCHSFRWSSWWGWWWCWWWQTWWWCSTFTPDDQRSQEL